MIRASLLIWSVLLIMLASAQALSQSPTGFTVQRPSAEPALHAEDKFASIEAWAEVPAGTLDLMGRFEAVVEIRADAQVRIEDFSIADILGDAWLITVMDEAPLARTAEIGDWFGRYRLVVEPLVDGQITLGPLRLTYLIDPDPETDPTQLEPVSTTIASESIPLTVTGPGGSLPDEPHPAKEAARPDEPFDWRALFITGAAIGVVAPILAAFVLAVRTTRRRTRNEAPQRCMEQLDALERVVRAAGPSGMAIDGPAVATEALTSIRVMLDESLGLRCRAMSGAELVESRELRGVLSVDAFDHLRTLVERTESVRFAGGTLDEPQAHDLIASARRLAQAVQVQQQGRGGHA
ncbi:MAG: hypothetical protein ACF8MJ_04065 [Phycisphaerales bacterium JB050]